MFAGGRLCCWSWAGERVGFFRHDARPLLLQGRVDALVLRDGEVVRNGDQPTLHRVVRHDSWLMTGVAGYTT